MNLIEGQSNPINTSALKTADPYVTPELRQITPQEFSNFTYTGISIDMDVPIVKISSEAMFAINIDGFIPNMRGPHANNLFRNLFPVQPTVYSHNMEGLRIKWEAVALPALFYYYSHRYIEGDISLALRITSNTAQSGNLLVAQVSGVTRYFYSQDEEYRGLRFMQDSMSPIDYAPNGFAVIDLSLNRHVGITPCRRDNTVITDLAKKVHEISKLEEVDNKSEKYFPFANQFLEDWIIVGPQTSIPHDQASTINIAIYFDWSRVKFYTPMLPIIPLNPTSDEMQILDFSLTFTNKDHYDDFIDWKWLPRDVGAIPSLRKEKHHARFNKAIRYKNAFGSLVGTLMRAIQAEENQRTG